MGEVPYELVVALIGDKSDLTSDVPPELNGRKRYGERRTTPLKADGSETLASVLGKAAVDFGLSDQPLIPRDLAFYRAEDEEDGDPLARIEWSLAILAGDGRVRWTSPSATSLDDLVKSGERGSINGDPLRPYYVVHPPVGDGLLPDWHSFVHALEVLRAVLEILVLPGGVAATGKLALDALKLRSAQGSAALASEADTIQELGADPIVFDRWLDERPWLPKDLSDLLGCSEETARGILWALGFAPDSVGLYRRRQDEPATFLSDQRNMAMGFRYDMATEEELRELFAARARELATTGEAPPQPDARSLSWLEPHRVGGIRPKWWRRVRARLRL